MTNSPICPNAVSLALCYVTGFTVLALYASFWVRPHSNVIAAASPSSDSKEPKPEAPRVPVKLPRCCPQSHEPNEPAKEKVALAAILRGIHRPIDIKKEHLEAMGICLLPNAAPEDIIPDPSYLPPEKWSQTVWAQNRDDVLKEPEQTLNNGRRAPSAMTYVERRNELSTPNEAAYRTVRRLGPAQGERPVRLGNAYEFFKNLELMTMYWVDTSTDAFNPESPADAMRIGSDSDKKATPGRPQRPGAGIQIPHEFRNNLLTAFVKLVAYDFSCNVSPPRVEPRLHLNLSPSAESLGPKQPSLHTYFQSGCNFIHRIPSARAEARTGVVEGPLVALSSRAQASFNTPQEELLDLSKEIVALLITAQQRAREGLTEQRVGEGQWWCSKPRWGGGTGGPIGREIERYEEQYGVDGPIVNSFLSNAKENDKADTSASPSPAKKPKKSATMMIYDSYRMVRPPSSTWDRKAKYEAIGKVPGADFDDVFLVSCLFHHVSVLRARVRRSFMAEMENGVGAKVDRENCVIWRSKWYDLFLVEDRLAAMNLVWGMMAYLMRASEDPDRPSTEAPAHENV